MKRRHLSVGAFACAVLLAMTVGCGGAESPSTRQQPDDAAVAAFVASTDAQLSKSDPCSWVPAADVERLLGPLGSAPIRVHSAERSEPSADGSGCEYQVLAPDAKEYQVSVEVVLDGALTLQTGLGVKLPGLGEDAAAFTEAAGDRVAGEWDWSGGVSSMYAVRQGHIAVMFSDGAPWLGRTRLDSLAYQILDGIPDVPFIATTSDLKVPPTGRDPCSLLSSQDASSVLGVAEVRSYRSRDASPLAHSNGPSCTYYLGRHRVLVLTPTWSDAGMMFNMLAGVTRLTGSVVTNATATDTLEGPWDAIATGMDGSLYLLKADRMLAVEHGLSSITAVQLINLMRRASARL